MAGGKCCKSNKVSVAEYNNTIEIQQVRNKQTTDFNDEIKFYETIATMRSRVKTRRTQIDIEGRYLGGVVNFYVKWTPSLDIKNAKYILWNGDRYQVIGSPLKNGIDGMRQEYLFETVVGGDIEKQVND